MDDWMHGKEVCEQALGHDHGGLWKKAKGETGPMFMHVGDEQQGNDLAMTPMVNTRCVKVDKSLYSADRRVWHHPPRTITKAQS